MKAMKTSGVIVGLALVSACGIMGAFYLLQIASGAYAMMMTPRKWLFYFGIALIGWFFGLVVWTRLIHSGWLSWLVPRDDRIARKIERIVCFGITLGLVIALSINPLWLTSKLFVGLMIIFLCYFCCQEYRGKIN